MNDSEVVPAPATTVRKRAIVAWSLWDWGSAAFQAVVTTFVFTVYLTSASFGPEVEVSAKLSLALSIAGIIIAVFAPVTGRLSDAGGRRKQWLVINTAVVVAAMVLMVFVAPAPEFLMLGLVLLAVGNIAFEFASVSYNAMLTQISNPGNMGRISGFGWGMGYFGGIVLLALLLVGFIQPDVGWFGVTSNEGWNIRVAMVVCAAWFAVFAIPVMIAVPEVPADPNSKAQGLLSGYVELFRSVVKLWRTSRQTLFFLIASAIFRDGLAGVFTFVGIIASLAFGFEPSTVIIFAIAANVISGVATMLGGLLEDFAGAKNIMMASLTAMIVSLTIAFFLASAGPWVFWVFGLTAAVFVGPVQSSSRTYLARLIPAGSEGEIFGLYATTGRAVSFLAPAAFGVAVTLGGSTLYGVLGLVAVLLLGLLLLIPVRKPA